MLSRMLIRRLAGMHLAGAIVMSVSFAGCQSLSQSKMSACDRAQAPLASPMPRECSKVVLPEYRIEPPDVLMIDAAQVVPQSPYRLRTLDTLAIQVLGTLPDSPISGLYVIQPGGVVNLGFGYGSVGVAGMTVEEAQAGISRYLERLLNQPIVSVALSDVGARQQISGQHLVGPDGTVTLGMYGSVSVVGLTVAEAKLAIEQHLKIFLEGPEVSVSVFAFNSKIYYVIVEGAGFGDRVYRFPVTGNETVLDAISQIQGLNQISSKKIWIARPSVCDGVCQVLPVCWEDITAGAQTTTNFQVLPGDRVFVAEDKLVATDTALAKFMAPIERLMGFTLLGTGTATRLSGPVLRGGGNPNSTF
jgi:polysaccharide biosynthesis/export protein